jgi:hypothetical protein
MTGSTTVPVLYLFIGLLGIPVYALWRNRSYRVA